MTSRSSKSDLKMGAQKTRFYGTLAKNKKSVSKVQANGNKQLATRKNAYIDYLTFTPLTRTLLR